jgi:glycosyltransferase involved in cell wall biosynthesis
MDNALVSVICLCYNQASFVEESIRSVLNQTYKNIQLIVVDDASTDDSIHVIRKLKEENAAIEILALPDNKGNCTAFNLGFTLSKGDFIIDFAADDVMMPERIEHQVKHFSSLDESYGVSFTDAIYVNEKGETLREHYSYLFRKGLIKTIPQGNVYNELLYRYFIASPTMMVKRTVMESLNGYDETLSYEDFDFWIRSARNFNYAFLNEKLTKIRKSQRSMSSRWYVQGDRQLYSTYLVCKKAHALNRSEEESLALAKRLKYELRQSVFSSNHREAVLFYNLLTETGYKDAIDNFFYELNKLRLPLSPLRKLYHYLRFE